MNTSVLGTAISIAALALPIAFQVGAAEPNRDEAYGAAWTSDGIGNQPLGAKYEYKVSYRFRAQKDGTIYGLRYYNIYSQSKTGYNGGTGGQILIELQTDDGTPEHKHLGASPGAPASLASFLIKEPLKLSSFPLITLDQPVKVEKGTLYHAVFTNVDPDPASNFVSANCLIEPGEKPRHPGVRDEDFTLLWTYKGRPWGPKANHTPIFEVYYQDGTIQGQGYVEAPPGGALPIGGPNKLRETFVVTEKNRTVSKVSVRVRKDKGSPGPLTVRLEKADGSLIEEGEIPADSVGVKNTWVSYSFKQNRELLCGEGYNLVLSAPVGDPYQAPPIRVGCAYGMNASSQFTDGYAQHTTGEAWHGWKLWNRDDRTDVDLQFCFTVVASTPVPPVPVTPEQAAAAKEQYVKLRDAIIAGVKADNHKDIANGLYRQYMLPGKILSADEKGFEYMAVQCDPSLLESWYKFSAAWESLPPARFYLIAREYTDDHKALAAYCRGMGLVKEAESEERK
jgi:hypothetical protein